MNVFLTVDTEIWPREHDWRSHGILDAVRRDVYGVTRGGEYGVRYQTDRLNAYGLKAVYFVEALFASAVGLDLLRTIVDTVQTSGHEVQLHVHTEWLRHIQDTGLPGDDRQHIRQFSAAEQRSILMRARDNLEAAGVPSVTAFRAGNFGSNLATLQALATLGIRFDSSYNVAYLGHACRIPAEGLLLQPCELGGIVEVPVSFFRDLPGHYRPAHLNACSSAEMQHVLLQAWRLGWKCFVIVTHSFDLLSPRRDRPDSIVLRRFEALCRFLADHRDKFTTIGFADAKASDLDGAADVRPLASSTFRTAWRVIEQLKARCAS